ncbi:tetratricopeptide repeat protein [Kroppenstedtia sanguinis]|uniref:Tetratricopeptide repeat protein n=1 Tax=Kroppenstedtia sanguinis TaxID=1380684 RepID=A0ABW4CCE3_9BACL
MKPEGYMQETIRLREAGRHKEAKERLLMLTERDPDNASFQFQGASVHDFLGLEREAVPFYERALRLDLCDPDRRAALLGLGFTYRCLGEYERAAIILEQGIRQFPEDRALQVF